MEQPFSTSKVTVEYHDPHGVYKLIAPSLISRLPLHNLHWQSHSGPLRSIDTLHIELVASGAEPSSIPSHPSTTSLSRTDSNTVTGEDGFQTATVTGRGASGEHVDPSAAASRPAPRERRHQIPGLRQTPYLKILLVRCDDNDSYKTHVRSEIRDWIKQNARATTISKKSSSATAPSENHDAFEWMVVHVVLPNSAAAAQPRTHKSSGGDSTPDLVHGKSTSSSSRWGKSSSTLLEKLRADFNSSSTERVVQIRVGINDVPYELLPRVATVAPSGYLETEKDAQNAWADIVDKLKTLILASFDVRVSQYEEDIREKDLQRTLPGWNFCTFFILKEGLARGFESVGLVEDALVGYDELSVGLDTILREQQAAAPGTAAAHGGALLSYTQDLEKLADKALATIQPGEEGGRNDEDEDEETVDLQGGDDVTAKKKNRLSIGQFENFEDIPISSSKKPYRELILANNVSVFDFRCYIFTRQVSLLLRLGNAWSTREELLARLREQQNSVLLDVKPPAVSLKPAEESENLSMLAEICRRTLEFIPAVSRVMREDLLHSLLGAKRGNAVEGDGEEAPSSGSALTSVEIDVVDNIVASYAFSVAHQILAQTASKSLPIPPPTATTPDGHEPKVSIPEPKTMMHPARSASLQVTGPQQPPVSPGIFPGPGSHFPGADAQHANYLKNGLEDLAARRADLFILSRNIVEEGGKKRGWSDGWASAPVIGEPGVEDLEEISLDDDNEKDGAGRATASSSEDSATIRGTSTAHSGTLAGTENVLLRIALEEQGDFYKLYETLTDEALRHYSVAGQAHSMHSTLADLAVLKYHLRDYAAAASYFYSTTPFFGKNGWSLLELSLLIMYARSLKELDRRDEYAGRLLKLLGKAAASERDRLKQKSAFRAGKPKDASKPSTQFIDRASIQGYLGDLLETSRSLSSEMLVPLTHFFNSVEVDEAPIYQERQDGVSVILNVYSLLVDDLPIDIAKVRMVFQPRIVAGAGSANLPRDVWLETRGPLCLSPGKGKIRVYTNAVIPGIYEITQIRLVSRNLAILYDKAAAQQSTTEPTILKEPHVILYQRTSALDVRLSTSKDLQLDKNNFLVLELLTGWNDIATCDVRIRAATGGLRLITTEAKVLPPSGGESKVPPFAKPIEGGVVSFGVISADTSLNIALPFSIEQDALDLTVKIDVSYTTSDGSSYSFAKTPSVSTALALGVNVQDVFKHNALFSRFTVSTASGSPLRLFRSELVDSEVFSAHFGVMPQLPPMVFPKQPASLLYKIFRRPGVEIGTGASKTMHIKLYYSVLQDDVDRAVEASLVEAFKNQTDKVDGQLPLYELSRTAVACVLQHVHDSLTAQDLERVALISEFTTSSALAGVDWPREFPGMGGRLAEKLGSLIQQWQTDHPRVPIPQLDTADETHMRSIRIAVDIPSITIVHTADIRLQEQLPSLTAGGEAVPPTGSPLFCVNQLLPATLSLKWTRMWDTAGHTNSATNPAIETKSGRDSGPTVEDLEFSFEVTAPTDAWLIGGRRKGHFVIPAAEKDASGENAVTGLSSTPETEATIPLVLIPLREGWLPYPSVEIREVVNFVEEEHHGPHDHQHPHSHHHCETDYRNLGETVQVVADRTQVTLSLDASGPAGGPLVLETEQSHVDGRVVV